MFIRYLAAVAGLLALTGAAALDLLVLGSSTSETAIAGASGPDSRLIGTGGNYQGLYRIVWAENADIPCYFRTLTRHLNQGATQQDEANLGGASCQETNRSQRSVGFNTPGLFVNGIQVCRINLRVKGITLYYVDVGPKGTVTPVNRTDAAAQHNCSYNSLGASTPAPLGTPVRYCPAGNIATQIKVYFRPENPPGLTTAVKQSATGISLICRPVEVKD